MKSITSKALMLPVLSLLLFPVASFAKSTVNATVPCPDPTTSCPQTMTQANSCNWQTLPSFPTPSDPLNYQSGPTSGFGYSSVCMYTVNQAPYYTGLYYAGNSSSKKK